MKQGDTLKIVVRNLRRRKGRTILTAIGVTIGTAAIVAMMSLAIGLKENAINSVNQFGNISEIEVYPGWNDNGRVSLMITDDTLNRIESLADVSAVMAQARFGGQADLEIGKKMGNARIVGVDDKAAKGFEYKMFSGHYLSAGRREAVVTYDFVKYLKNQQKRPGENQNQSTGGVQLPPDVTEKLDDAVRISIINKNLTITVNRSSGDGTVETKDFQVRISGVLDKSQYRFRGPAIFVPLGLLQDMNQWAGTDNDQNQKRAGQQNYETLVVKVPDRDKVESVVNYIKAMGYQASSTILDLKEINQVFTIIQVILGGIGAISLLVATIGIINTMVMSILERTREIGIMKVLGATIPNIRNLFLLEAGTIGFIGGVSGLGISYLIAGIINLIFHSSNFLEIPEEAITDIAVIPLWLSLFALSFATIVGVIAGIYPALRAARLSPLNAIRQE